MQEPSAHCPLPSVVEHPVPFALLVNLPFLLHVRHGPAFFRHFCFLFLFLFFFALASSDWFRPSEPNTAVPRAARSAPRRESPAPSAWVSRSNFSASMNWLLSRRRWRDFRILDRPSERAKSA